MDIAGPFRQAVSGGVTAPTLYARAGRWLPWCVATALATGAGGALLALLATPAELPQGQAWRIAFVHLPAAWLSMALYAAAAALAMIEALARPPWPAVLATALAPTGALMCFLTLWSGALWTKPLWGHWWIWDARLLAEAVLLVLFLGFMALRAGLAGQARAARAGALLLAAGLADLAVLASAVRGWSPLHGPVPSGLTRLPALDGDLRAALLLMTLAFTAWSVAAVLHRMRTLLLLEQARDAAWAPLPPAAR
jgi:heme exporter protein C